MAKYGEDSGMKTSPTMDTGYLVCAESTNWVESFKTAAMALENIGDISEPVRSDYGVHFIKYVGDAVEGPVDFESIKEKITAELTKTSQDEAYSQAVIKWVEEADAKIHLNRMK